MEKHFPELIDYEFTKGMEEELDEIAGGRDQRVPYLKTFYWGDKKKKIPGLHQLVTSNIENIDAAAINSIFIGRDEKGELVIVKPGRYGPYLKRGEDTVSVPETLPPDELTIGKALELLAMPKGDTPLGVDPITGLNVYAKQGRFGAYVQLGEMLETKGKIDKKDKPKTASLFKDMKLEGLTLEQALELLRLPRVVGVVDGEEVIASNGRYGPYLRKGKETRNLGLESERKLLTLTLDEAMLVLNTPKQFRGRGQPRPPLKTFAADPVSGKEVVLKEGRFGFYVTDGETNASLRRGDEPTELTAERAHELLELRREYLESGQGKQPRAKKVKAPKPAKAAALAARAPAKPKVKAKAPPKKAPRKPAKKKSRPAASR
jgi:DNA topoisomerase-1